MLLSNDKVEVFNLRTAPFGPEFAWPMAGHDAQRTGCSDCPEDLVTAVDDGVGPAETRVSFAAPHPNPTSSHAAFNIVIPGHAVVSLDIIDLRGRRVRTIERSEMQAGAYRLSWDGRDQSHRPVGDGIYYARLKVSGPGLNETITRKVVLVR